jgi:4-alpha-glucanotransferase
VAPGVKAKHARRRSAAFALDRRSAGVLLHVTSLPGPHGNGDLGPEARRFVDFLAAGGQRWWQTLPANPVGSGNSPYSGASAFAGNPLLISLDDLASLGLLEAGDVRKTLDARHASYDESRALRGAALRRAFERHERAPRRLARALESFRRDSGYWLGDYALYMALRDAHAGRPWTAWPRALARREPRELARARRTLARDVAFYELEQLLFRRQWQALRRYASERGVGLIGDAPIFVAHESADVWSHAASFTLDRQGEPTFVAGVPPDYFSKTGQRWGNPLYRWRAHQASGFEWWIERFRTLLEHFDVIRLDHFIGFMRYWRVPASEKTAERGSWQPAPGQALFAAVERALGSTPFIAEDLGEVTPAVRALRDEFGLPGMRVLQFAFGSDVQAGQFLPHCYIPNTVAYTGTHDNDTFLGWYLDDGSAGPRSPRQARNEKRAATAYLAGPGADELAQPQWEALRALYGSVARTVIAPLQDILGLDNTSRMNSPGSPTGNWEWRVPPRSLTPRLAKRLHELARVYERID